MANKSSSMDHRIEDQQRKTTTTHRVQLIELVIHRQSLPALEEYEDKEYGNGENNFHICIAYASVIGEITRMAIYN